MEILYKQLNLVSEKILNPFISLLFAVATLVFLWGAYKFLFFLQNDESRRTGGRAMLFGILGMVIMLGVKGIIAVIVGTIGAGGDVPNILR